MENKEIILNKLVELLKNVYIDLTDDELKEFIQKNEELYKDWNPEKLDDFIKYYKENKQKSAKFNRYNNFFKEVNNGKK